MFCIHCGQSLKASAYSCPHCGFSTRRPTPPPLRRPMLHRRIAGVCAAIALHYGWRPIRVRIAFILLTLFHGIGLLAYLIAWIIIPAESFPIPMQKST